MSVVKIEYMQHHDIDIDTTFATRCVTFCQMIPMVCFYNAFKTRDKAPKLRAHYLTMR